MIVRKLVFDKPRVIDPEDRLLVSVRRNCKLTQIGAKTV